MDIEAFSSAHPIAYVHIAYAVVWLLHFGFVLWIVAQWRKLTAAEKDNGSTQEQL